MNWSAGLPARRVQPIIERSGRRPSLGWAESFVDRNDREDPRCGRHGRDARAAGMVRVARVFDSVLPQRPSG